MARKVRYLSKGWRSKYDIEFYSPFKFAIINQPLVRPGMVVEAIYEKVNPRKGVKPGGTYLLFILNVDQVTTRRAGNITVHCLDLDVIRPHMFIQVLKKIGGGAKSYKNHIKKIKIRGQEFRIFELDQNPRNLYRGTLKILLKTIIPGSYKSFEYYHGFRRFKLWDFDFGKEQEIGGEDDISPGEDETAVISEIEAKTENGLILYGTTAVEAIKAGTATRVKK